MRILPILFHLQSTYGTEFTEKDKAFQMIHNVSSLTHSHVRSHIACGIYISVASMLLGKMDLKTAVNLGIYKALDYFRKRSDLADELQYFERLERKDFHELPIEEIKSSGYVIDTIEAAIWCLLNTNNYKDCVLKAVNLGEDTDTVAAVSGVLAGLRYGYESIPKEWLTIIVKREYIEGLCDKLHIALRKTDIEKLCSFIPYFETATKESVCQWSKREKLGREPLLYGLSYI